MLDGWSCRPEYCINLIFVKKVTTYLMWISCILDVRKNMLVKDAANEYTPKAPLFRHFRVHIDCEFRVFLVFLVPFRLSQNNPVNQLSQGAVLFRDSQRVPLTQ